MTLYASAVMRYMARLALLMSCSVGAISAFAAAPFFSPEIRALVEPCSALLLKDSLHLNSLESNELSAELLRAHLEKDAVLERFHQKPRIGISLTLLGVEGQLVPRIMDQHALFGVAHSTLDLFATPSVSLFESARAEARKVFPNQKLRTLWFMGASHVARGNQNYFVFQLGAETTQDALGSAIAQRTTRHFDEAIAMRYLRDGHLTSELVIQSLAFAELDARSDPMTAEFSRTEIAALRRVGRDLKEIQGLLEGLPLRPSHPAPLGSARQHGGYRLAREEINGRQQIKITRLRDDWSWTIGEILDVVGTVGPGRETLVRKFLHVQTNGSVEDIREALKAVSPFFPMRRP